MSKAKCILDAKKNSGLDDDHSLEIATEIDKISRSNLSKADKKAKYFAIKESRKANALQARVLTMKKIAILRERFEYQLQFKNKEEAVASVFVGTKFANKKGSALNSKNRISQIHGDFIEMLDKGIKDHKLSEVIKDIDARQALELDLLKEVRGEKVTGNAMAKGLATVMGKIDNEMVRLLKAAGLLTREKKGRSIAKVNDPQKISTAGFKQWYKDTVEWSGEAILKESFPDTVDAAGKLDYAKLEPIIENIYKKVISRESGVDAEGLGDISANGRIGTKPARQRLLDFKDAESELKYHKAYGNADIYQSFVFNLQKQAKRIAQAETFVDKSTFEKFVEATARSIEDPKERAKFDKKKRFLSNLYDEAFLPNRSGTSTASKFFKEQRAATSIAKLGLTSALAVPTDFAMGVMTLRAADGTGILHSGLNMLNSSLKGIKKADRGEALKAINFVQEGFTAGIGERLIDDADAYKPGVFSRHLNKFFSLTGLNAVTNIARSGVTRAGVVAMADTAKRFSDVDAIKDPVVKARLNEANILSSDLVELRKGITKLEGDGVSVITVEALRDAKVSEDIVTKFHAFISDRIDTSVIQADALQNTQLNFGSDPDTIGGAALRSAMQFKSFALKAFRVSQNNIFRRAAENGVETESILKASWNGKTSVVQLLILSAIAGYTAKAGKAMLRGQEPPDPFDPETFIDSIVQGGGMGLYGDMLLGEYDKYKVSKQLLGPGVGIIDDAASLLTNARKFEGKKTLRDSYRLLENFVPNFPLVRQSLDYLILRDVEEFLTPGAGKRRDKRFKEQGGVLSGERKYMAPVFDPTETAF